MEFIYITIILLFSAFIIFWIYRTGKQRQDELTSESQSVKHQNSDLVRKQMELMQENAQLKATLQSKEDLLKTQQLELMNTREQLNKDFQVLANKILEENSSRFTDVNRHNMESILKPLAKNCRNSKLRSKKRTTRNRSSDFRSKKEFVNL